LPQMAMIRGMPHMLAWITGGEAAMLRDEGGGIDDDGSQIYGPGGVPAFFGTSNDTDDTSDDNSGSVGLGGHGYGGGGTGNTDAEADVAEAEAANAAAGRGHGTAGNQSTASDAADNPTGNAVGAGVGPAGSAPTATNAVAQAVNGVMSALGFDITDIAAMAVPGGLTAKGMKAAAGVLGRGHHRRHQRRFWPHGRRRR
jgi:hypothetical protein